MLVGLFNMPAEDYKRFLSFLKQHECHLPFKRFRTLRAADAGNATQSAGSERGSVRAARHRPGPVTVNFWTRLPSYVSVMKRLPFESTARLCAP